MELKSKELEREIREYAREAWVIGIEAFYFPPLEEPNYIFDYTKKEGFFIDPENKWKITMNLSNVPLLINKEEYIKYFTDIILHEISHYQVIPYDGLTHAKLLRAAMKRVNHTFAPIVVNIFSDIVIDYKLFQDYPDLMIWELQKTHENFRY